MKNKYYIVFLCGLINLSAFLFISKPKDPELKTTCYVLANMIDTAIVLNQKDLIVSAYNTYLYLTNVYKYKFQSTYFDEIKNKYSSQIEAYCYDLTGIDNVFDPIGPGNVSYHMKGSFTHKEIDLLNKIKDINLKIEDLEFIKNYKENQINKIPSEIDNSSKIKGNNKPTAVKTQKH